MFSPLDLGQTAPPAFLLAEKAVGALLGYNDLTLRALPLVAGCLLLPCAWIVARRVLDESASALVVGLLALSPTTLLYDNFIKQYASDMLVTALVLWVTLRALERPDTKGIVEVGLAGVAAQLFSSSSVFVLVGVGGAIAALVIRRRLRELLIPAAVVAAAWLAVFLVLARTAYARLMDAHSRDAQYMHEFWSKDFLGTAPGSMARAAAHLVDGEFLAIPGQEAFSVATVAGLVALVAGLVVIAKRRSVEHALLLALPLGAVVLASAAQKYPMGTRLVLFVAPILAIAIAAGVSLFANRLPGALSVAAVVAILLLPLAHGLYFLRHPIDPAPGTDRALVAIAPLPATVDASAIYVRRLELPQLVHYANADSSTAAALLRIVEPGGPATLFPLRTERRAAMPDSDALNGHLLGRPVLVSLPPADRSAGTERIDPATWGAREVDRIRRAARCAWVFIGPSNTELSALQRAIAAQGGEVDSLQRTRAATHFRTCFRQG